MIKDLNKRFDSFENRMEGFENRMYEKLDEVSNHLSNRLPKWAVFIGSLMGGCIGIMGTIIATLLL